MTKVLLTAFKPYDRWQANASWLAIQELTKALPAEPQLTTRLYPVDFAVAREKLTSDLTADFDYAIHLGQAPGTASVRLEAVAINVGGRADQRPEQFEPLVSDGPAAFRTGLPLGVWSAKLRAAGIPAHVSYHAGTYLCNAVYYWSQHFAAQRRLKTKALFVHLPLDVSQTIFEPKDMPSLPSTVAAHALRLILQELGEANQVV